MRTPHHSRAIPLRRMAEGSSSWLDRLKPDFLREREGDFVKLEGSSEKVFGPGPLLVLVRTPPNIDDDEVRDMLHDAAPVAFQRGCTLYRIAASQATNDDDNIILDLPLQEALDRMVSSKDRDGLPSSSSENDRSEEGPNGSSAAPSVNDPAASSSSIAVLFFSGFTNPEMLAVYNLLGDEIYQETGGQVVVACAKAVPNAVGKPLRQVLDEIAGDHQDAMQLSSSKQEE